MKIDDLSESEVARRLIGEGLFFRSGPFNVHLQSEIPAVQAGVYLLYGDYSLQENEFADFHIRLYRAPGIRHWVRPQVEFELDGAKPFKPLPLSQAFPMFEWTFNWCVANHMHRYLIIHSAVVEKNGQAAILPAPPGSGKSTLCAALVARGWRLLSDEMALISPESGLITPVPRPVSLKNQSIDIIKAFAPEVVIGPAAHDTNKGTVAHMRAPSESIRRASESARPRWVVFPKYTAEHPPLLEEQTKGRTLMELAENGFNYNVLAKTGFETVADVVDGADCYRFTYSRLEDAIATFDQLAGATP